MVAPYLLVQGLLNDVEDGSELSSVGNGRGVLGKLAMEVGTVRAVLSKVQGFTSLIDALSTGAVEDAVDFLGKFKGFARALQDVRSSAGTLDAFTSVAGWFLNSGVDKGMRILTRVVGLAVEPISVVKDKIVYVGAASFGSRLEVTLSKLEQHASPTSLALESTVVRRALVQSHGALCWRHVRRCALWSCAGGSSSRWCGSETSACIVLASLEVSSTPELSTVHG
jgi:hypothetical protein